MSVWASHPLVPFSVSMVELLALMRHPVSSTLIAQQAR